MRIAVFGSGYVGLVAAACFAEMGNKVVCVDVDEDKIALLNRGEIPIYETGLQELVQANIQAERLSFTTDGEQGVIHGLFQMIAVGTPPDEDGSADLQYVLAVAQTIGRFMNEYKIIVNKSTVPVGTADKVRHTVQSILDQRKLALEFDVVSNPEFLKEGSAISDFMKPDRTIVGTDNPRTTELLRILYSPFHRNHNRMISMDIRSAELTKYAANALLATKISFMNEMSTIAEKVGADIEQVRIGIGSDPRIGYHFIYPGAGYGGSCFPKDVKALIYTAQQNECEGSLLQAVKKVNDMQKYVIFNKIHAYFQGNLSGKTIALWGLAYKPNTDDMREAPSRVLMELLWQTGAKVQAYDPAALQEAHRIYGQRHDLLLCESPDATLENADALAILTEWKLFRSPDFQKIKTALNNPVIFDGRNLYDPFLLKQEGIQYYAIGRGYRS